MIKGERVFAIFLAVVFLVMAAELLLLFRQNQTLETTVATMTAQLEMLRQTTQPPLRAGEVVLPLEIASIEGAAERLAYDDERTTVLFFFAPNCGTCDENLHNWKRIEESADPRSVRVVYLSTAPVEETSAYAKDHGISAPFVVADYRDLALYRVFRVPSTLVIGKGGVVKNAWVGTLSENEISILGSARS